VGRNELASEPPLPAWRRFLAPFKDVLVVLLLLARAWCVVVCLYDGYAPLPHEAFAIAAVVLLNAVMGFVQEGRAEAAVAAIREMTAAHATVIRDGARSRVVGSELVPGDLIAVDEGAAVPADARLIASTSAQTSEAALTGESLPVSKDTAPVAIDAVL